MAFVQKGFAPFDHFAVDLLGDLRAEMTIAPTGQGFDADRRCCCSSVGDSPLWTGFLWTMQLISQHGDRVTIRMARE